MAVYDLGSLLVHIRSDAMQYNATMGKVQKSMVATQALASRVGMAMSTAFTLPLAIIGGASVKAFAGFNQEMTKSLAIMGEVDATTKAKMEQTARSLATESISSAKEMARSYFYLASAGLDAEQSIAALPAVEAFAVAGAFDMAQATDLATDAQSALGMTVKDSQKNMENMIKVTDILVGANTLANASTEQFSLALTSGAGTAMKNYGVRLEEGVAVLAAYADQGIKAEKAGNLFSRMLRLTTSGFAKNSQAWKRWGLDIYDATGALKPMGTIVTDLSNALNGLSTKQKVAALDMLGFQARSAQAILPLLGMGEAVNEYTKELDKMNGVTKEVAEKQLKSFSNQLKITWNQLVDIGITLGDILAPKILAFNEKIKEAIAWFNGLSDATKNLIVDVGLIVAAIGPLALVFSLALKSVLVFTTFLGTTFGTVLVASAVGIISIITLVQDLRAAFDDTGKEEGSFLSKWLNQFKVVQVAGAYMASSLLVAWEMIKHGWNKLLLWMKKGWVGFKLFLAQGIGDFVKGIGKLLTELEDAINKLPDWLKPGEGDVDLGGKKVINIGFDLAKGADKDVKKIMAEVAKEQKQYDKNVEVIGTALGERLAEINKEFEKQPDKQKEASKALKTYGTDYSELLDAMTAKNETWMEANYENVGKKIDDYANKTLNVVGNVTDVAIAAWDEIGNGLADMLLEGQYNWDDFANQIVKDLVRIYIKAMMTQAAMALIGNTGSGAGGYGTGGLIGMFASMGAGSTAGAASSLPAAGSAAGSSGAVLAKYATGGIIGQGPLKSDERVIVAHDGEVIVSKDNIKGSKKAGEDSSSPQQKVEINIQAIDGQNALQFLSKNKRAIASLVQTSKQSNHPLRRYK